MFACLSCNTYEEKKEIPLEKRRECNAVNWLAAAGPSTPEADRTLGGDAGVFPARTVAWATSRGYGSLRRLTQSGTRADGKPSTRVDYERSN